MNQWVCTVCGYNMIGTMPDVCPFCGARHDAFLDAATVERDYRVTATPVSDAVTQLMSVPRLGLEHAAYRVQTRQRTVWIDCPSAFNRDLEPAAAILFTHKDFMGASNQYRALWGAEVYLHQADASLPIARQFPVDHTFTGDFQRFGIEAFHIGGHSPGFTIYIYADCLFACDYAFPPGRAMHLNPFGPAEETRTRGKRILEVIAERNLRFVCGYNYVADFEPWRARFRGLVTAGDA